jgi:hypothetical protein
LPKVDILLLKILLKKIKGPELNIILVEYLFDLGGEINLHCNPCNSCPSETIPSGWFY